MLNYSELKKKYGTPLYVYDVDMMQSILEEYKTNFCSTQFPTEIIYASKAFNIKALLRIIDRNGLSLDVVSLGELFTARSIDFPMEKIFFHGNNKSVEEIKYALDLKIGYIVVDNLEELKRIYNLSEERKQTVNLLIRLNVGVEAHTHKFIVTAHVDSKFGVLYQSKEYLEMLDVIKHANYLKLEGFHSHIGSQIFDMSAFDAAIQKLIAICKDFSTPMILNLGGGFGAKYVETDKPVPIAQLAKHLIQTVEREASKEHVTLKKLCIEPGRSIVCEAGTTLYTIGSIKETPNRLYYFIDGGMTDNIRPALYQANYHAEIVGKENAFKNKVVTVAGKCCESGDIIIERILLPEAKPNDLLVTYSTGAYGYAMSSNYNKALTPAVVFVEKGTDRLVVKRQTLEELIKREL